MCCNQDCAIIVIVTFDIIYMAWTGFLIGLATKIRAVTIGFCILSACMSCCYPREDTQYKWVPFMICKIVTVVISIVCVAIEMGKIHWITTLASLLDCVSNCPIIRLKYCVTIWILTLHVISLEIHDSICLYNHIIMYFSFTLILSCGTPSILYLNIMTWLSW